MSRLYASLPEMFLSDIILLNILTSSSDCAVNSVQFGAPRIYKCLFALSSKTQISDLELLLPGGSLLAATSSHSSSFSPAGSGSALPSISLKDASCRLLASFLSSNRTFE